VIIFTPPGRPGGDYIKRVIALPGDTVEIKSGVVYVNDEPLEEDYIISRPRYTMEKTEVAPGQYFVLGDNRANSNDSHTGWLVPRENIVGKAWFYLWPPPTWGLVPEYDLGL
jgi:signal peptidase I